MAGVAGRSGGANAKSLEEHLADGTFRPGRHKHLLDGPEGEPVSPADARRVLAGLPAVARRVAARLLKSHTGWDAAGLESLRAYAFSCARVEELQRTAGGRELREELKINLALLRALNLE